MVVHLEYHRQRHGSPEDKKFKRSMRNNLYVINNKNIKGFPMQSEGSFKIKIQFL